MYSTREGIKAAVDAYRAHIAGRNRRALEVYVQLATQVELDPEDWGDEAEDLRVDCFGSVLSRNDARTLISSPEDMLTKYDELAPLCDLDESALKAKCLEEVRDSIAAPPELRILAEYVGALTGPGMGETKWTYQAVFWTGASPQTEALIDATVKKPQELTVDGCWDPWAWRYMAYGPDDSKTFDTIPELLEWYRRYREREVPEIENLEVEDVLEGNMY
ncbi:uncharacterized protein N0V96_011087 [Colletotrichum fioriniae]|uniref:uncharacterized protein n=1 Tax=Colletotrichum fioriniae TaxID=710243 RepID=UPI0032DA4976|nr:hypothetical protein N0V96_011087 [Colletotrichum fioriniae]